MSDLKITVDQLKNYLGTGLKIEHCGEIHTFDGMYRNDLYISHKTKRGFHIPTHGPLETMKPICYRISDLDKEIEHNGERFVPLEKLKGVDGEYSIIQDSDSEIFFDDDCSLGIFEVTRCYALVQKLFEWHFWPFGEEYFEKGLVIDKRKEATNG